MCKRCDITVRKFELSDLDAIRGLIQNTIDVCYSDVYSKEAVRFFKDWHCDENVLKDAKKGYTIVLEKDGRITVRLI